MWLIRKKDSPYWQIQWREQGRIRTKSTGTKDRRKAMQKLNAEEKRQALEFQSFSNPPIRDVERQYFRWAEANKQPRTVHDDMAAWAVFLKAFRPERLGDIQAGMVAATKQTMTGEGKWSPNTWNKWRRTMSAIYNACSREIFLPDHRPLYQGQNPFAIRSMPAQKREYTILEAEQVPKLLEAAEAQGRDTHLYVALGVLAGLRKKEAQALRWEWIDFDRKVITIKNEPPHFRVKNGKASSVGINMPLLKVLMLYRQPAGHVVRPGHEWRTWDYRFNIEKSWNTVRKSIGLPSLRYHDLRHTFVTLHLKRGVGIEQVSKAARHSNVAVTSGVYSHLDGCDAFEFLDEG